MSDGFVYIAEHGRGISLTELKSSLGTIGLQLANPANGVIATINEEGNQCEVSEATLAEILKTAPLTNFQFWFSDSSDLFLTIRQIPRGITSLSFWVSASYGPEYQLACQWAAHRFCELAKLDSAALFVIDRFGMTADFDWDGFPGNPGPLPKMPPEVLGFDQRIIHISTADLIGLETRSVNNCLLSYDPAFGIAWEEEGGGWLRYP
jgi:hypothetical protein